MAEDYSSADYWNNDNEYASAEYWETPEADPAEGIGDFKRGLLSGAKNLQAIGGGVAAIAGDAIGSESLSKWGIDKYKEKTEEAGLYQGETVNFDDINSVGSAVDFAQFHLGSAITMFAPMILGGGAGGVAAKAAAKKGIEDFIEREAAAQVAAGVAQKEALQKATELAVTRGKSAVAAGAAAGGGAASVGLETGSIYGNIYEETGEKAPGKALVAGTVAGTLDVLPFMGVLKKMGLGKKATDEITDIVIDGLGVATAKVAGTEAVTEGLQTIIERSAVKWVDENKDIFTPEGWSEIRTAIAAGAVGGTGLGAGAHVATGGPLKNKTISTPKEPNIKIKKTITKKEILKNGGNEVDVEIAKSNLDVDLPSGQPATSIDDVLSNASKTVDDLVSRKDRATGIDRDILTAEKMGFDNDVVRLRNAKRLSEAGDRALERGQPDIAESFKRRSRAIYDDIIDTSPDKERIYTGEVVGPAPVDGPNFVGAYPPPAVTTETIDGTASRVDTFNPPPQGDNLGKPASLLSPMLLDGPQQTPIPSQAPAQIPFLSDEKQDVAQSSPQRDDPVIESRPAQPIARIGQLETPITEEDQAREDLEREQDIARLAASEKKRKVAIKRRSINTDKDSILSATIKLGGVNSENRMDVSRDTAVNKNLPGIGYLFSPNGTGLDDMATLLHEQGYIPASEMENLGGVPYLTEALSDELSGIKTTYAVESEALVGSLEDEYAARMAELEARESELSDEIRQMADDFDREFGEIPESLLRDIKESSQSIEKEIDYDAIRQELGQAQETEAFDGEGRRIEKGEGREVGAETGAAKTEARANDRRSSERPEGETRRVNDARRARIERMSPDEVIKELYIDKMTGLLNKRAYTEDKDRYSVIAYIDLDGLKYINDTMGHGKGDELLAAFGEAMGEGYHISGDEFAQLFNSEKAAKASMAKIEEAASKAIIESDTERLEGISFSYGIASSEKEADKLMREQKAEKRAKGVSARGDRPANIKPLFDLEKERDGVDRPKIDSNEDRAQVDREREYFGLDSEGSVTGDKGFQPSLLSNEAKDDKLADALNNLAEAVKSIKPQDTKANNDLYSTDEREDADLQGREDPSIISEPQADDVGRRALLTLFPRPEENKKQAYADLYGTVVEARPVTTIKTGIDRVLSEKDLAHLIAPIRKDAQEAFYAVAVDAEGNVLRIMRSSRGAKGSSSVYPLHVVSEAASINGIDTLHYAHNHPSGNPDPSPDDRKITSRLNELLDGLGIKEGFHVVVGQNMWGGVESNNSGQIPAMARTKSVDITERRITKRGVIDRAIDSSESARQVTGNHDNAVFLLNSAHAPVAIVNMSPEEMATLRSGGSNRVLTAINKSNASAVIIKSTDRESAENVSNFLSRFGSEIRVLDILHDDGDSVTSLASKGWSASDGVFFSKKSSVPDKAKPKGVSVKLAKSLTDKFLGKYKGANDVNILVHETQEEAFGPKSRSRDGRVKGGYDPDTNTLHLVAEHLDSKEDVIETLQHEIITHKGLGFFAPEDVAILLNSIQENAPLSKTLSPIWSDIQKNYDDRSPIAQAEELLAYVSQQKMSVADKYWNRIVTAIRTLLKKAGWISDEISVSDLRSVVYRMADAFEDGKMARQRTANDLMLAKTYHGSPHKHDGRLDPSKIGTGEGAQAYGYGHYMAENIDVAKGYSPRDFDYEQILFDRYKKAESSEDYDSMQVLEELMNHATPDEIRADALNKDSMLYGIQDAALKIADEIEPAYQSSNSHLYTYDVDDDAISKMLDWDKPLSEQSESVREALLMPTLEEARIIDQKAESLAKAANESNSSIGDPLFEAFDKLAKSEEYRKARIVLAEVNPKLYGKFANGSDIYDAFSGEGNRVASERLRALGITGIKYFDSQSREKGEGTRNFVIFPGAEDIATPISRNGVALNKETPGTPDHEAAFDPDQADSPNLMFSKSKDNAYTRGFNSLGDKDKTVFDRAKNALKREFSPGGLLPRSVFEEQVKRDSQLNVFEFDIANRLGHLDQGVMAGYDKKYSDLSEDIKLSINEALGGSEPDMSLPESVREEIYKMRSVIKSLSRDYAAHLESEILELKKQGSNAEAESKAQLLQTIINNMDTYVHRSYRAFDDPKWPRKVSRETYDAAAAYLENQYADGGDVTPEIQDRVSKTIELMLEEGTAFDSMEAFIRESKLGAKDLSVLQRKKQIAPEIRALLGEYTDPKINFTKSVTKMSRLVMNQRFLDRVKELGMDEGFLFTKDNRPLDATRMIAADSSESYAPLNGLYTYPEIDQAFKDALGKEQMADWFRAVVRMNGAVKYGKTILSPTTAARNWMSAAFFAMANGHFNFSHIKKSTESVREYFSHGEGKDGYLKKLKSLGVIYDTPYAGEMMDLLADSQLEHSLYDKKPLSTFRKMNEYAQKFYQYGDDFWKIMGFENEKALLIKHKNLSVEEAEIQAAERIRNTYPTYSMTGRFIQKLRRFPLAGTFVSFPSEIVRTSYHIIRYLKQDLKESPSMGRRKVAGLAIASGMIHALQAVSMSMMGMDDDDEEAFRSLAAPWQENSNLLVLGRDSNQNIRLLDMSFLDPYNYWKRPINAMLRDQPLDDALKSSARELFEPFFGQDIAFGAIMEAVNNKKESGGRVFNPNAPALDQTADIANHIRKSLQPGALSNAEGIIRASAGHISPSGKQYKMEEEMAALVGFRATTFDPKKSIFYRSYGFRDKKRDATSMLASVARNPNKVSDANLIKAYGAAEKTRMEAYEEMIRLVRSAMNTGVSRMEIINAMRNSGISKEDSMALVKGIVPRWEPSDAMMRNAIKKASVLFDPETAAEFKRRQNVIKERFNEGALK